VVLVRLSYFLGRSKCRQSSSFNCGIIAFPANSTVSTSSIAIIAEVALIVGTVVACGTKDTDATSVTQVQSIHLLVIHFDGLNCAGESAYSKERHRTIPAVVLALAAATLGTSDLPKQSINICTELRPVPGGLLLAPEIFGRPHFDTRRLEHLAIAECAFLRGRCGLLYSV